MKNKNELEINKDFNTVIYFLGLIHGISKSYIPMLILSSTLKSLTPLVNIIIPKFIIDELINQRRMEVFITLVITIIIGNFLLSLFDKWLDTIIYIKNKEILNEINLLIGKKIMNMDFEKIEDPEVLNLKEKALYPINTQYAIERIISETVKVITNIITIISLVIVISTLDLYIILIILCIIGLNSFIYKKSQKVELGLYKVLIPLNRTSEYFDSIIKDFSMAKDIRLYDISPLIMGKYKEYNEASLYEFGKVFKTIWKYNGLSKINLQVQMLIIYAYMTYKVFVKSIGIGSFTMYVASAVNFSNTVLEFSTNFISLRQMCKLLETYIEFEQIKSINNSGHKKIEDIKEFNIEFKNVSFKYPRSDDYILRNISIVIKNGEKLSVVGLNGAGKTTFIKLLTRLYEPTHGEILLNGVNINEYNYEEYMKLLSVVFQDFKLMAFSIKENVALDNCEFSKEEEIEKVLKNVGLEKDILKLPSGINTHIYKTFEEDGIEFSGGQSQKLAISRAIFKNSPIVILDEPTAALDPIAEADIYSKFNELIGGKTVIYISHRLSSCKFCDKIAVFHKGEIIQYGTHKELVGVVGSQYESMYMAQAQYYV